MSLSVYERAVVCAHTQLLVWSEPFQSLCPFPLLPITPALKCRANLGAPIVLARSCRTGRKRHPRGGRSPSFSSAPLPSPPEGGSKKNLCFVPTAPRHYFSEPSTRAEPTGSARSTPQQPWSTTAPHSPLGSALVLGSAGPWPLLDIFWTPSPRQGADRRTAHCQAG